jgi:membrane associated rhomboid family serine protease
MSYTGTIGLVLLFANFIISYRGFKKEVFFERYKFEVDRVLINKDYVRLVSSGFLHVNWAHVIFNMISLYSFSGSIELGLGSFQFLLVYFASLVGGNLLSLLIHKNHGDYSSVGASGAVCGVIFASLALFPGMQVGIFMLPVSLPGWIYGLVYVLFSIYGIRSGKDNIGHEAHLGGGLIGMATALLIYPAALIENYQIILIISIPTLLFIYLIITRPHILLVDNFFYKEHQRNYSIDHRYNADKRRRQEELDKILDKISKKGMGSLSKLEKKKLKEYSKQVG